MTSCYVVTPHHIGLLTMGTEIWIRTLLPPLERVVMLAEDVAEAWMGLYSGGSPEELDPPYGYSSSHQFRVAETV